MIVAANQLDISAQALEALQHIHHDLDSIGWLLLFLLAVQFLRILAS